MLDRAFGERVMFRRRPRALRLWSSPAPAPDPLGAILRLGLRGGLPLHIARRVGATAGQRHDVIDNVTEPPVRMPGLPLEHLLRFGPRHDTDAAVAGDAWRCRTAGSLEAQSVADTQVAHRRCLGLYIAIHEPHPVSGRPRSVGRPITFSVHA